MEDDKESRKHQIRELFRKAKPAGRNRRVPQIMIRGDNNLINVGARAMVRVKGRRRVDSRSRPPRKAQWPQQILDAIRVKALETRRSQAEVCEIAGHALGRAVLTLEKLTARDLARVYEAVCAGERCA
jgi:hypothetical protein